MPITDSNPKVITSTSITLSIIASGPCVIDRMVWTSVASSGSIHFTDMTGIHVFDGIAEGAMNIIDNPTIFPKGLRFASASATFTDSTSSTAMEVGKLFVWVR